MDLIRALVAEARLLHQIVSSNTSLVRPDGDIARLAKATSRFEEAITIQRDIDHRFLLPDDRYRLIALLTEQAEFLLAGIDNRGSFSIATESKLRADALLTEAIQFCRALAAEFPDKAAYKSRLAALENLHAQHFGSNKDTLQ